MKKEVAETLKKPEVAEELVASIMAVVAGLLQKNNVEFTADDLTDFVKSLGGKGDDSSLSDEDLENVAGGGLINFGPYNWMYNATRSAGKIVYTAITGKPAPEPIYEGDTLAKSVNAIINVCRGTTGYKYV